MIDIAKERALCDAATKGPWETDGNGYDLYIGQAPFGSGVMIADRIPSIQARGTGAGLSDEQQRTNIRFLAHARTAYPAALDELESLRAQLASVTAERDALGTRCGQIGGLKSRIAELNVELDRAGSKHDAAVRRADDAEALLREARAILLTSGGRYQHPMQKPLTLAVIDRIDAHLSAKEKT